MDEVNNPTIDIVVSLIIILAISAQRFNTWPDKSTPALSGSPTDYINSKNYVIYFAIYVVSIVVMALAFYGIPDLLKIAVVNNVLTGIGVNAESKTFTIFSIITFIVLNIPYVNKKDQEWRAKLHDWARIPRDVEDIKSAIIRSGDYCPTERYLELTRREIAIAGMALQPQYKSMETEWLGYLNNYAAEKSGNTQRWQFLQCLMLLVVAKDLYAGAKIAGVEDAERKLREIGQRMLAYNMQDCSDVIADLENMSNYFIECICKYVVKNYDKKEERCQCLSNLGFAMDHQDCIEIRMAGKLVYSIVGIAFCSVVSVAAIRLVLEVATQGNFTAFETESLLRWSVGSFLSLSASVFFAAMIAAQNKSGQGMEFMLAVIACIVLSTLASSIYYIAATDLDVRSVDKPFARVILAMSFSMLSPFVYRALTYTSFDSQEVVSFSVKQGVMLGVLMMVFQCLVSLSFNFDAFVYTGVINFFADNEMKMTYMALIGFAKGMFLGVYISYLVQRTKRNQMLESLRRQPRASAEMPMQFISENATVVIKDLSKNGLQLESRTAMKEGDVIKLQSSHTGEVSGLVKWIVKKAGGRYFAGVLLEQDYPTLHLYLRDNHGAYYA